MPRLFYPPLVEPGVYILPWHQKINRQGMPLGGYYTYYFFTFYKKLDGHYVKCTCFLYNDFSIIPVLVLSHNLQQIV